VGFSTPRCAFLFDIYTLGDAAFDNRLRDKLQSETIEKVIHECHIVADYLHHKHIHDEETGKGKKTRASTYSRSNSLSQN
jgi:hypothetical protein